jgi:hypothetical protein
VTNGNEATTIDVEYIDSEDLVDLPDVDATLSVCCYFLFIVFYCTIDFSFRFYSLHVSGAWLSGGGGGGPVSEAHS